LGIRFWACFGYHEVELAAHFRVEDPKYLSSADRSGYWVSTKRHGDTVILDKINPVADLALYNFLPKYLYISEINVRTHLDPVKKAKSTSNARTYLSLTYLLLLHIVNSSSFSLTHSFSSHISISASGIVSSTITDIYIYIYLPNPNTAKSMPRTRTRTERKDGMATNEIRNVSAERVLTGERRLATNPPPSSSLLSRYVEYR